MGWMQSSGGVHIAVAMAKVSSWMGLMQTNGGVHMGTDTVAIAATQCEEALAMSQDCVLATREQSSLSHIDLLIVNSI